MHFAIAGVCAPAAGVFVMAATSAGAGTAAPGLYVGQEGGTVVPVDQTAGTAGSSIPVGAVPYGVAITPDGARALVTSIVDGDVTPIDLATARPGRRSTSAGRRWGSR